jgi:hypothetical protein
VGLVRAASSLTQGTPKRAEQATKETAKHLASEAMAIRKAENRGAIAMRDLGASMPVCLSLLLLGGQDGVRDDSYSWLR